MARAVEPAAAPPAASEDMTDAALMQQFALSAKDVSSYRAARFEYGQVPETPPPPPLCY